MEDRLTELETIITHQESTLDELNGVIARQQKEIQKLKQQVQSIVTHIRADEKGRHIVV